jgi:hypothetical protein
VLDRSFRQPLDHETRAGLLEWAAAVSPQAAYDVLASQRDLDLTSGLPGVRQPAIVIHGRYDRARSRSQRVDPAELFRGQLEVEDVEVLHDPLPAP